MILIKKISIIEYKNRLFGFSFSYDKLSDIHELRTGRKYFGSWFQRVQSTVTAEMCDRGHWPPDTQDVDGAIKEGDTFLVHPRVTWVSRPRVALPPTPFQLFKFLPPPKQMPPVRDLGFRIRFCGKHFGLEA